MTTEPVTHKHRVGMCPSCRDYLWAEVDVVAEVSPPTLAEDGKAHVFASARCVAMRIAHECDQRATGREREQG